MENSELKSKWYQELKDTVTLEGPNLILIREIGEVNQETARVKHEKILELASGELDYCMLIDVTKSNRPDAKTRYQFKKQFKSLTKIKHIAIFNDQNFLMNMVAKFVVGSLGANTTTVTKTKEEALEALKPYLQ